MSFLEVFDRAAGATKSGGTTRRAAKMVCLDMDHPEIVDFINWKVREEKKAHGAHRGRLLERLQRRGLPHRQRAELEQLGPRHRRLHEAPRSTGGEWQTRARTTGEVVDTLDAQDLWNTGRRGRVGAAPIRACSTTRTINQLAHLPEHRADQRVEPVLRVHVPRRHGLQPVVART